MLSKRLILWLIAVVSIMGIMQLPPISQDLSYHAFADQSKTSFIENGLNVLSNQPFILVGIYAIYCGRKYREPLSERKIFKQFIIFAVGVFLVGFGSGYYHYEPNNITLIWDRLPMTIAFMALYSIIVSVFISSTSGKNLLPWLLVCGFVSVGYWALTESMGSGDLRMYALVQFLPMILIVSILFMYKDNSIEKAYLISTMLWYGIAKLLEAFDEDVYHLLNESVSGHSLKHVAAAIASLYLVRWCTKVLTNSEIKKVEA